MQFYKLNKCILAVSLMFFSVSAAYSAEAYYCQYEVSKNTYRSSIYYDDARECNIWKSENMRRMNPGVYEDCMHDHAKYKQSLANGGCIPLYREIMYINKAKYSYLLNHKHKKIYSYNCQGDSCNIQEIREKLKIKYPDYQL